LAARFIETRAHEALGFRSLADWSRERIGIGARAVSEWGRVWRRLEELPLLLAAVRAGEVGWTVARLVVRHVTPECEAASLDTVRGRTVRAVKALVAAVESADPRAAGVDGDAGDEEERVAVRVGCSPELTGKWQAALELARRMSGEPLPVWQCAEVIAAEVASALGGARTRPQMRSRALAVGRGVSRRRPPPGDENGLRNLAWKHLAWSPARVTLPDGAAREFDRLAEGLGACSAHELDQRFRAAIAFLQSVDLEMGAMLRQVVDRRLYRELGFESFERYVTERLDLSPRTARRMVRLARAEHGAPQLARAFGAGALTAFQAEALLRVPGIGTSAAEEPWVSHAQRVTLRRLDDDVPGLRAAIVFQAPVDVAEFFLDTLERVREALGREGPAPGWRALEVMLDHAISAWTEVGRQFRDYADFERDDYRCTVPGCTSRRNLQSHHIRFRSAGGPDEPGNRTTLCAFHHQRGVHDGRVRIAGRAPGGLIYALGTRRRGPPLARFRSGDIKLETSGSVRSPHAVRAAVR
jgi:hypothetical protein